MIVCGIKKAIIVNRCLRGLASLQERFKMGRARIFVRIIRLKAPAKKHDFRISRGSSQCEPETFDSCSVALSSPLCSHQKNTTLSSSINPSFCLQYNVSINHALESLPSRFILGARTNLRCCSSESSLLFAVECNEDCGNSPMRVLQKHSFGCRHHS